MAPWSGDKGYSEKGRGKGYGKRDRGGPLTPVHYGNQDLPRCIKEIYSPAATVQLYDERTVWNLRFEENIEVSAGAPAPVTTLDVSTLVGETLEALKAQNIRSPTPIQMQVWPAAMSGYDIIGVAPTGSGKTLAYLVPMIEHCKAQRRSAQGAEARNDSTGPMGLVLAPTVELAKQIYGACQKIRRAFSYLQFECMVPGENYPKTGKYDILVASCGKLFGFLSDHPNTFRFSYFKRTTFVVVDEADMLILKNERAGEQHATEILSQLRPDIQSLFFTATWDDRLPEAIRSIWQRSGDCLHIVVEGKKLSACKNVQQFFLRRNDGHADPNDPLSRHLNCFWPHDVPKKTALFRFLAIAVESAHKGDPGNAKVLVFANSKEKVEELYDMLKQNQLPVEKLTSEGSVQQRTLIVENFANPLKKDPLILVTTDMLGRGIDFTTCMYVVLYEFPHIKTGISEYVHRIGRTARAGRTGFSITFLDEAIGDLRHCKDIAKVLEASKQPVPQWIRAEISQFGRHVAKYRSWRDMEQRNRRDEYAEEAEVQDAHAQGVDATPKTVAYGKYLKDAGIPCQPFPDLNLLRQEIGAPLMDGVETERQMPFVF